MKKTRKIISIVLAVLMIVSIMAAVPVTTEAKTDLPNSVFVQQQVTGSSGTCTLASATMMMRARTYLSGNSKWSSITEQAVKSVAWSNGLNWSFTYNISGVSISVSHTNTSGISISSLKSLINSHPEGIVLYSTKSGGMYHAVLITDYEGDTFYCADPAPGYSGKRIALKDSQLGKNYGGQAGVLSTTTAYWYVSVYSIDKNTIPPPPGKQTIADGDYHIASALDLACSINVADGNSNKSGTNVHLWRNAGPIVTAKWLGSGYYSLIFKHSGMSLDVHNAGTSDGTNVLQYSPTSNDNQKWIIKDAGGGYYNIISKCNGMYVDAANGSSANGTNIQMWTGNDSKAQKWKFYPAGTQTIADGDYHIASAIDNAYSINVAGGNSTESGMNVHLWKNGGPIVKVKHIADGYYSLVFEKSGMSMDVLNAGNTDGTNVLQYKQTTNDNQRWVIRDAGDGCYSIISKCNGLYVDVSGGSAANGTNIQMWTGNGSKAQKWKFFPAGSQTISDGDYHIASALDLGCTINVAGGNSTESGANVQLWKNGGPIVTVKHIGDGYYSMVFKKSGMAMDVYDAGYKDGTNVLQYKQTTNDNQKWIIKQAGDDYYFNIVSKCNGLYLDVAGGGSADGTNIQMYHGNDTPSQKWRFYREPSYTDKSVEEGKYRITSKLANSLSLDIADKSGANMSNVQVFNREVKDMDTFDVEYLDNGLYTITPTNMNRRLDVVNNVPYNKADVQIYDKNTSASQKWILQPTDDGYYNIIAQGSGLYLDVSGGGKTDGTNVQVYLGNDTDSQKWKLSIVKNEEETSPATEPITTQPVTEKPTEITEIEPTEEPPIETTAGAVEPTEEPTAEPVTGVIEPTEEPTIVPTTGVIEPVEDMTVEPVTIEAEPTEKPTAVPTTEAVEPTEEPIVEPTTAAVEPTEEPTIKPTKAEVEPTEEPIAEPTTAAVEPTEEPIIEPTTAAIEPTEELIIEPTTAEVEPTEEATMGTVEPTVKSKDKTNNKKTSTPKSKKSKKKNTISVKAKTKSIKLKKLKKKAQTVKPLTVKKAKGKVTYKLIKKGTAKKIWKYLKISKKGAITVKKWKKAKKGTYKIKVKVTAAGNKSYRKGSKTVTAKIKIK